MKLQKAGGKNNVPVTVIHNAAYGKSIDVIYNQQFKSKSTYLPLHILNFDLKLLRSSWVTLNLQCKKKMLQFTSFLLIFFIKR